MKMEKRVALQNMRYHKSKNRLIGIAIVLTTMLLFLIPTIGKGMIDGQFAMVNELYPTWHAAYRDVDETTIEKLAAHHDIAAYGLQSKVGSIVCEQASISMYYLDETGVSLYQNQLKEGNLPKAENEIVVSKDLLASLGLDAEIGDTITISYQIYQNNKLGHAKEKAFVITGLLESGEQNAEQPVYSAFVGKQFVEQEIPKDVIRYHFLFQVTGDKNVEKEDIEERINQIAAQFQIENNRIQTNDEYLAANYVDPAMIQIMAGIMLVIVFAGVITIYSIYYVNMPDRIQEFGRLKAIGATTKQIKSIVLWEGMLVTGVALPAGLLLGTLLAKVILKIILNRYLQMLDGYQISLCHGWIYLLTCAVVFATVYVSLWKPRRVAAKISEMEAIRYQPDMARKNIKRKSFHDITVGKLSHIYLLGNKRKSMITILSMSITGVFFIVVATILSCANPKESASHDIYGQYKVLLQVEHGNQEHPEREWSTLVQQNPLDEELKEQIEKIDGVTSVYAVSQVAVTSRMFPEEYKSIAGMPKEYEQELLDGIVEGKATIQDLQSGDKIILNRNFLYWYPDVSIGDYVPLTIGNGNNASTKEVEVVAIGDYAPGLTSYSSFLMLEKGLQKLYDGNLNFAYQIYAKRNYDAKVEQSIKQLIADSDVLQYESWQSYYEQWKSALEFTNAACYAFLGVLGAICIMNMVNTMLSGVHIRKKEIGMMQAIGMTDRQVVKMLQQEGLVYTGLTLVLSIGVGSLAGYPVFLWAKNNGMFSISQYHYPIAAVFVVIVVMLMVQMLLAYCLGHSVKKESLIERIRFSE